MPVALEVVILLLLIMANGLLAMSELAVVSSRKPRLQQRADDGHRGARVALRLAEEPTRFLSTVQVGITLIGVLTGAFGGARLGTKLSVALEQGGMDPAWAGPLGVGLVVVVITYLSLVVGELAPKRIALGNPERIAAAVAVPMRMLSRLTHPFVKLLEVSTGVLTRLLGGTPNTDPPVTDEEITHLLAQGAEAGVFESAERELVENVLWLGDQRTRALMTPRRDIVWLDLEDTPEENREKIVASGYSSFPVARGDLDEMVGIVRAKDLLARLLRDGTFDIEDACDTTPLVVPGSLSALKLLEAFRSNRRHVALVVDEHGSIQGLITNNEILESVAELENDPDDPDPEIVRREDGSYLLDGGLSIDELKDVLDVRRLPDEDEAHYHTLAGFILDRLGHIPVASESFEWGGFSFEIVDLDHHRVDKVLVTPLKPNNPLDALTPTP
jgi:putative hemolysin